MDKVTDSVEGEEVDAFLVIPSPLDNVAPVPKLGSVYFDRRQSFNAGIAQALYSGAPFAVYSARFRVIERLA